MLDLIHGATYLLRGLSLLGKPVIRRYAFAPMALAGLVFAALAWVAALYVGQLSDMVVAWLPDWLDWLHWLLWPLAIALFVLILTFSFVIVVGLLAAPFNGLLAEATERHLTGRGAPPTPLLTTLRRLPRTLFGEVKKVLYTLLVGVPFLLLFVVPVVNLAAPILWFALGAWLTTFAFVDYAMSNHGLTLGEIRAALARRRMLALGFGALTFLALATPFVNILALPAAVCGATALWVERLRDPGGASAPTGP